MASFSISASLHRACRSHSFTKKQRPKAPKKVEINQASHLVSLDVQGQKSVEASQHTVKPSLGVDVSENGEETGFSAHRFRDERWKNGTWDLNMFVKNGRMVWDAVIVAEARRRKFLELYPEASTNQEPVQFRSSIIPWWAWLMRSHLPEAELLNGRAAMVGFFMSYIVDVLTGLDMVGQTGNFVCKAVMFVTVAGIILFRRTEDVGGLRKLADEATYYDKQWQASWQDQIVGDKDSNK